MSLELKPLAMPEVLAPKQALKDARKLVEFAASHPNHFSLNVMLKLEVVISYLEDAEK